jgi:hypothetical protein
MKKLDFIIEDKNNSYLFIVNYYNGLTTDFRIIKFNKRKVEDIIVCDSVGYIDSDKTITLNKLKNTDINLLNKLKFNDNKELNKIL